MQHNNVYQLEGYPLPSLMAGQGFDQSFVRKFSFGFPSDWKALIKSRTLPLPESNLDRRDTNHNRQTSTHDTIDLPHTAHTQKPLFRKPKNSDNEIRCIACKEKFSTRASLLRHIKYRVCMLTTEIPGLFKCDTCPMVFPLRRELTRHEAIHREDFHGIQCVYCKHIFSKNHDLIRHIKQGICKAMPLDT